MSGIIVMGDVMLDKFSYGKVKRLNPEWPNPLLHIVKEEYKLWGAANVAANIAGLDESVSLIGAIGDDENGERFKKICEENKIHLDAIHHAMPTITKQRFIENTYRTQLLRVDYEEQYSLQAKDNNKILKVVQELSPKYIVISDYNKGITSKDLIQKMKEYSKETGALLLVDTKPSNVHLFDWVYLLKPNVKEFRQMIGQEIENTDEMIEHYGKEFVQKNNCNIVITRGAQWASLITKSGEVNHLPTEAREVFDVTWAWDTFLATLTVALSKWYTLSEAVKRANKASWIVVGEVGTAIIKKGQLMM